MQSAGRGSGGDKASLAEESGAGGPESQPGFQPFGVLAPAQTTSAMRKKSPSVVRDGPEPADAETASASIAPGPLFADSENRSLHMIPSVREGRKNVSVPGWLPGQGSENPRLLEDQPRGEDQFACVQGSRAPAPPGGGESRRRTGPTRWHLTGSRPGSLRLVVGRVPVQAPEDLKIFTLL